MLYRAKQQKYRGEGRLVRRLLQKPQLKVVSWISLYSLSGYILKMDFTIFVHGWMWHVTKRKKSMVPFFSPEELENKAALY